MRCSLDPERASLCTGWDPDRPPEMHEPHGGIGSREWAEVRHRGARRWLTTGGPPEALTALATACSPRAYRLRPTAPIPIFHSRALGGGQKGGRMGSAVLRRYRSRASERAVKVL